MSVTFTPTLQATDFAGTIATCFGDGAIITPTPRSYEDASLAALIHSESCKDETCHDYGANIDAAMAHPDLTASLNVTNINAAHILEVLGLPYDPNGGELDATDFKGRVLLAMALNPADAGVPATTEPGPGATMINCGRREGYTEDRLTALLEVAEAAIRQDRSVSWN